MIINRYLADRPTVTVSFVGDKSAEISGTVLEVDQLHIVLLSGGKEKYIPWTAVGAVTNHSKPIVMDEEA